MKPLIILLMLISMSVHASDKTLDSEVQDLLASQAKLLKDGVDRLDACNKREEALRSPHFKTYVSGYNGRYTIETPHGDRCTLSIAPYGTVSLHCN